MIHRKVQSSYFSRLNLLLVGRQQGTSYHNKLMQSMVQQKRVLSTLQLLTSLFAYMRTLPDYPGVNPIQQQYGPTEEGGGGAPGNSYQTRTLKSTPVFRLGL